MTLRLRLRTPLLVCLAVAALIPAGAQAVSRHHITFGAWTPGAPYGGDLRPIEQLEGSLQRHVGIVNWYQDWGTDSGHFGWNITKAVGALRATGRLPMLTWEPYKAGPWEAYSNRAVTSGAYDGYIRQWAAGVARLRTPVYVRLAHEMNGNWYPWGGPVNDNGSAAFKAMWRHVVDVARSAGARNIRWVWSPLTEDVPNTRANRFERYYPGRAYVDVLALDGYNWGADTPQYGGWRTFRKIFTKPFKRIRRLGSQPVWIAEIGSASDGGDKSRWVRSMFATARKWKRLKAIVWYNQDKECGWSTTGAASAFRG
ncbi:MAG: glycoside hydrolase family 26 protein [Solirubrobacteraceae bacterium]